MLSYRIVTLATAVLGSVFPPALAHHTNASSDIVFPSSASSTRPVPIIMTPFRIAATLLTSMVTGIISPAGALTVPPSAPAPVTPNHSALNTLRTLRNVTGGTPTAPSFSFDPTDTPYAYHCLLGNSTYVDQGSEWSPWQEDCRGLVRDIDDHIDHWTFGNCAHRELVSHGTCHFGIESTEVWWCDPLMSFEIGNGDIITYVLESLKRFSRSDGRVGAKGVNKCANLMPWGDEYVEFEWGIY